MVCMLCCNQSAHTRDTFLLFLVRLLRVRAVCCSACVRYESEVRAHRCRRQLVDLLLCPTQFFLNIPPQDHATARALLVGFLPDSEIADMVGPYQGHWTVTARDVPLVIRKQTLPQVRQSLSTGRYKGTLIASL